MKIASIVGARPQFIKLAPLSREIRKKHKEVIIHTGQHYDQELSEIFFKELKIPKPDYNLEVGSGEQGRQVGEMLIRIEEVLQFEKPDWVIVFGDTNSTLAGALAAAKLHIPLAHVEAGMRSYNSSMPEEINRKVTDHLSQLLFCPSKNAVNNLRKEGLKQGVYLVGDLMREALTENIKVAGRKSKILKRLRLQPKGFYLVTIHRAENTDSRTRLKKLASLLSKLGWKTIFPVHPRTKKCLQEYGLWSKLSRFKNLVMLDPVGYLDMLILEENARAVLTDSGGVQREAYFLGAPCVILRNETEWSEMMGKSFKLANDLSKLPKLDFAAKRNTRTTPKFKTSRIIVSLLSRESVPGKR
jgi:UDP-N-acetylglucosamine 2-epimerase